MRVKTELFWGTPKFTREVIFVKAPQNKALKGLALAAITVGGIACFTGVAHADDGIDARKDVPVVHADPKGDLDGHGKIKTHDPKGNLDGFGKIKTHDPKGNLDGAGNLKKDLTPRYQGPKKVESKDR